MVKLARNFVHRENSAPGPCIMYSCIRWREGRRRLGQVQEGNIQKGRGGGATPLASSSFFFFFRFEKHPIEEKDFINACNKARHATDRLRY